MSKPEDKYQEGTDMSNFNHLVSISTYNHNYYNNSGDLLYGESDDDNETEWYLIKGSYRPIYLGYSLTSERNAHLRKGPNT